MRRPMPLIFVALFSLLAATLFAKVDQYEFKMWKGEARELPADESLDLVWRSEDRSIAAVFGGRIEAVKSGKTTLVGRDKMNEIVARAKIEIIEIVDLAAGGDRSAFIDSEGSLWAAGNRSHGQLGLGDAKSDCKSDPCSLTFKKVPRERKIKAIALGKNHTILLDENGSLWAAGANNNGQLGIGKQTGGDMWFNGSLGRVKIDGNPFFVAVAAGESHTLAIDDYGAVWATGLNNVGELGVGETRDNEIYSFRRVKVQEAPIGKIFAGETHSFAIDKNGGVYAAGNNGDGQLGLGDFGNTAFRSIFTRVRDRIVAKPMIDAACGEDHTVLLGADGTLWGAGTNRRGQLGLGAARRIVFPTFQPIKVAEAPKFVSIDSGDNHVVALGEDGTLWIAGRNKYGQLGVGGSFDRKVFVKVEVGGGEQIALAAAGANHTIALAADGTLWATGSNRYGQLGAGDLKERDIFEKIELPKLD